MDENFINRRQMLGVVAAAGAAGLAQLAPGNAQAAEAAAAAAPATDVGASQAPTIKDVKDKVAYITGGSSGIGLSLARAYAARGAHVAIFARNESKLMAARSEIEDARRSPRQQVIAIALDVGDEPAVRLRIAEAVA